MRARTFLLGLAGVAALATAPGVARGDDRAALEPEPPWVFFPQPDQQTGAEIDGLITNSFADQSKAAAARDAIVRRIGLVAVPRIAEELIADNNQTLTWNSLLTVYALRDRVGPARELWPVLEPTLAILRRSPEPYRKVFAALALGSFHGPDTIPLQRGAGSVVEVRNRAQIARDVVREAGDQLIAILLEERVHDVKSAAALALAKRGSDASEKAHLALTDASLWQDQIGIEPRQAVLCALGLLPGPGDDERFLQALKHGERAVRRAAALAITLQAVNEVKPKWMASSSAALLRALQSHPMTPALEDGAEAVFTRGVLALRASVPSEWSALYAVAVDPGATDEAATAAAQALLFCPETWLPERVVETLKTQTRLPDAVVAAFLRILGSASAEAASAETTRAGIALVREYLGNKGRSPRGDERWDVRYHAVVGVLRALAAGRLRDGDLRHDAVDALESGARRGLPEGPFRARLERLLDQRKSLLADPTAVLPEADVRAVERTFTCPYGLLSLEIEDLALHRLNVLVPYILHVHHQKSTPMQPDKTDQPQRFLKACLDRYPYFRRLELRPSRGLRAPEAFLGDPDDPAREVRTPR